MFFKNIHKLSQKWSFSKSLVNFSSETFRSFIDISIVCIIVNNEFPVATGLKPATCENSSALVRPPNTSFYDTFLKVHKKYINILFFHNHYNLCANTLTPYLHDSQALVGYVHSYLLCLSRNLNFISRLCTGYKVFCFLEFMNI